MYLNKIIAALASFHSERMKYRTRFLSITVCMICLFSFSTQAQSRINHLYNKFFNDTANPEKAKWLAYPTVAYSPETSWEFGVAGVYMYYANQDTLNRLSEFGGFTFVTAENQYGLFFDHALYSDQNKWFGLGKIKFQNYPLKYYGIGPNITGEELALSQASFLIVRERLLRKTYKHWYLGLEVDYQNLSQVSFDWHKSQSETKILGENGYDNLGFGLGLVYDTRHNVLNVRHGFLSEIGYLTYQPSWGSTHKLNTLFIDNRAFFKTSKKNVLAFQGIGQFSTGDVPFNQLSMIGGEMMMRGYYLGKFRDKNMMAIQAEHRWLPFPFSKRLGGAVFAAAGSVAPNMNFNKFLFTSGAGVRYLLFPKRDVYTRFDIGINEHGYGFYFFIGEAF